MSALCPQHSPVEPSRPEGTVLLVEPSPGERTRLIGTLTTAGFAVHAHADDFAATDDIPAIQPDLILARWPADQGRGDDWARRLVEAASSGRWIPVLLHAPRASAEDRIAAIELGALDLLAPIPDEPELLARLRAAVRLCRRMEVLERRAYRDGLTGLLNRGALDDQLRRQWDWSVRHGAGLSILIADLDHLKAINDAHGHEAGDEALRQAAAVLAGSVRSSDIVARRGGDEFLIAAPGCPTAAALAIAVRIREGLDTAPGPFPVTMSIGIAAIDDAATGLLADMLRRADRALLLAKRSGRNAVAIDDPDRGEPTLVAR